jgi:hypothetical protein
MFNIYIGIFVYIYIHGYEKNPFYCSKQGADPHGTERGDPSVHEDLMALYFLP